MSEAESASVSSSSPAEVVPAPAQPAGAAPSTPALRAASFLRITAVLACVATVFGVLIMPGARGLLADRVVVLLGRVTWSLAYAMAGFVIAASILACFELSRAVRMAMGPRVVAIGGAGAVMAFSAPSILLRLPTPVALAMSLATVIVTFAAVWEGLRAPHTRAVAVILAAFGLSGALRLVAWQMGTIAGDSANTRLYAGAQAVATAAVVFEALGQMAAAAWLGTRSRAFGQGLSSVAVAGAFVLTWGAAHGGSPTAPPWQAGLHMALANAAGLPPPVALHALATFLVCASLLLAFASAAQPRQVVAVVCALALALLGRGAFDVPLHALASTASALWLMVALVDDRAMWKSLAEQREHRLLEEREAQNAAR